ncbi:expressed unknown protein [Seminavis robusta]|uniref:RING-type domain-containing protein n=1 Tax=Seminavis robusta TaxID=568900 RepID=A0A9N8DX95_9STRA|nr:expressed unknown protein [Seminavis robusta]|eukprot:Sro414_g138290.1 n/a (193) ;mRNA; f:39473-40051
MGINPDILAHQPVNRDLVCLICLEVLHKPTTVCGNGHCFCLDCIKLWEGSRRRACPTCNQPMMRQKPLNRILQSVIMDLQVRCPEKYALTESTGDSASVECPLQCSWIGPLSSYLEKHKHDCYFKKTESCPLCKRQVQWTQFSNHIEKECPVARNQKGGPSRATESSSRSFAQGILIVGGVFVLSLLFVRGN